MSAEGDGEGEVASRDGDGLYVARRGRIEVGKRHGGSRRAHIGGRPAGVGSAHHVEDLGARTLDSDDVRGSVAVGDDVGRARPRLRQVVN